MSLDAFKIATYGAYVWSSYGLTFAALLLLVLVTRACAAPCTGEHCRYRCDQRHCREALMTPRRRRMMFVALIVLAVSGAATFLLTALNSNVQYNILPSDVFAGKAPADRSFRLGGMVEKGSVERESGSMQIQFDITDYSHEVTVRYSGVLPDLFREGQGVVVRGKLAGADTRKPVLIAEEVLAKHDENYMPPNVAEGLKKAHDERRATQVATDRP